MAFIFGNHFAYSSIKIGFKKKKIPTLLSALSVLAIVLSILAIVLSASATVLSAKKQSASF